MDENIFKRLIIKIKKIKESNDFYSEKYKNVSLDEINTIEEFKNKIPLLHKNEIFDKRNIDKILVYEDGAIFPSAGTTDSINFSFRYQLNNSNREFNEQLIRLFDLWFSITKRKTLIINTYPLGVFFPEGPYTVVNTNIRDDIIIYVLDFVSPKYENIIIVGQPHFIKHLIDLPEFNKLKINRGTIKFVLGGTWFPYTFEIYILKKLFGQEWRFYFDSIKSTYGTAENGLGVLLDFPKNLRKYLSEEKLDEIVPLVYQYDPRRFYIEEINNDLVITNLEKSNPELIRYNTEDKIKMPEIEGLPKKIKECLVNNIVYLHGRGKDYQRNAKIMHNLFLDFEYAEMITGNFHLNEKHTLCIQLNPNVAKAKKISDYFLSIFKIDVEIVEYDKYKFKKSLDRKQDL